LGAVVTPARPLAAGRDADVYGYGDGLVLRRYRDGRSAAGEAATLRVLADLGYPVPAVHSSAGPDIVMERVDGPTLAEALQTGAVAVADGAQVLADLHGGLHALDWPGAGAGESLLHLDLHPLNVLMGDAGPVVIDWSNAGPGPAGLDVAMSALILAQVVVSPAVLGGPPGAGDLVAAMLGELLARFATAAHTPYAAQLGAAESRRRRDPNLTTEEHRALSRAVDLARAAARG